MRKLAFLTVIALLFMACEKRDNNELGTATVSFNVTQSQDSGLKSTKDGEVDWDCPTDNEGNLLEPSYAEIIIDGQTYTPDVFRLDGQLYTETIKLDASESSTTTYTVSKFVVYSDDDQIIRATPEADSEYEEYVDKPVSFSFDITAFNKIEVPVEVLCFLPEEYTSFGFNWFSATEITLREAWFFGDICLNGDTYTPSDFNGSAYGSDLGVDIPAIMKIIVKKDGEEVQNSPFTNETSMNEPLSVQYPDILNIEGEEFTFELQLYLPDGNGGFSYQTYYTYTGTDDSELDIDAGLDGIIDFVVGTCGYGSADQTFAFLPPPVSGPNVEAGYTPYNESLEGGAKWRNFLTDGNGWELAVGDPDNFGTYSSDWESLDFTYAGDYFFSPDINQISFVYDGSSFDQTVSVTANGGTFSKSTNIGDLGTLDYMQLDVIGRNGQTVKLTNVELTVDGTVYPLQDFSAGGWNTWQITNFDFSAGFTFTADMKLIGQAAGEENSKVNILVGSLP